MNRTDHTGKKENKNIGGFTLIEVLLYVVIFSLTLAAVVFAVSGVLRSYTNTQAKTRIGRAAALSLSRMTHEIRLANSADTVQSSFGAHPGVLALVASSPTRTTRFYVDNGTLKFDENGAYAGDLTQEKVYVSSFIVRHIQVGSSSGIRVELTLDSHAKNGTTSETFYSTTVMRGSYAQ